MSSFGYHVVVFRHNDEEITNSRRRKYILREDQKMILYEVEVITDT